ncbi:hypothetical protein FIBSPDRAFT_853233 [Athelia psychrophila]|uniref:Uncharacterized protein n=1 Tax=Athelia psychrophila TaxID=1759441 RepID=A0A167T9T1_9AGAM|nr:hypothetical protein FIBSPDRAFT_880076 [Fibularhizoctonia sp. CBS 109695]KZP28011.1 hypothetical protein FIBSPDRAFT_853233 [Fibularhizoctonia sp. CBS 109695]
MKPRPSLFFGAVSGRGATALIGRAHYYARPDDVAALEASANKHEQEFKVKKSDAADAAQATGGDAAPRRKLGYNDAKVYLRRGFLPSSFPSPCLLLLNY